MTFSRLLAEKRPDCCWPTVGVGPSTSLSFFFQVTVTFVVAKCSIIHIRYWVV
ncbi:hypothetical protein J4Q44_G00177840, partial [Coregonus suidteri]